MIHFIGSYFTGYGHGVVKVIKLNLKLYWTEKQLLPGVRYLGFFDSSPGSNTYLNLGQKQNINLTPMQKLTQNAP